MRDDDKQHEAALEALALEWMFYAERFGIVAEILHGRWTNGQLERTARSVLALLEEVRQLRSPTRTRGPQELPVKQHFTEEQLEEIAHDALTPHQQLTLPTLRVRQMLEEIRALRDDVCLLQMQVDGGKAIVEAVKDAARANADTKLSAIEIQRPHGPPFRLVDAVLSTSKRFPGPEVSPGCQWIVGARVTCTFNDTRTEVQVECDRGNFYSLDWASGVTLTGDAPRLTRGNP